MAKRFYGVIGYAINSETSPGINEDRIEEHNYYGDVISNRFRRGNGGEVNDEFSLNVSISILADTNLWKHYGQIKYVVYENEKWVVTGVEPVRPRLILSLGGLYDAGKQSI